MHDKHVVQVSRCYHDVVDQWMPYTNTYNVYKYPQGSVVLPNCISGTSFGMLAALHI